MKKFNKILIVLFSTFFLCSSFSFINVHAYNIDDVELSGLIGVFNFTSTDSDNRRLRFRLTTSSSTPFDEYISISSIDATYELLNSAVSSVTRFRVGTASVPLDFIYAPDLYDYYILVSVHTNDLNHTFTPNRAQVYTYYEDANEYNYYSLVDVTVLHKSDSNTTGFTLVGKLPDDIDNTSICNLYLDGNAGVVGENCVFEGLIFMFDKSSQSASSSIITAINNSATKISTAVNNNATIVSGAVDSMHTTVNSGTTSSNVVKNDVLDSNDELVDISSEFESFEAQFNSDLTTSLGRIDIDSIDLSTSNDFVSTAAWVKVQFDDILDSSGIFKTSLSFVLLVGLALLLIGRRL